MNKFFFTLIGLSFFLVANTVNASQVFVYQNGVNLGSVTSFSGANTMAGNWVLNDGPTIGPSVTNNNGALFFYQGSDGLSFNILLNDGDVENENGSYAFDMTVTGSSPSILVNDDAASEFSQDGAGTFHGNWQWSWGADGGVIGALDGLWQINIFNILNGWSRTYNNTVDHLALVGTDGLISLNPNQDIILTNVAAVPLPAGVWLFGSALLGIGYIKRKRKNAL
jgi:hypothetical protein